MTSSGRGCLTHDLHRFLSDVLDEVFISFDLYHELLVLLQLVMLSGSPSSCPGTLASSPSSRSQPDGHASVDIHKRTCQQTDRHTMQRQEKHAIFFYLSELCIYILHTVAVKW